jgi:hypothetical protein
LDWIKKIPIRPKTPRLFSLSFVWLVPIDKSIDAIGQHKKFQFVQKTFQNAF